MLLELEELEPLVIPFEGLLFCVLNVVPSCFSFNTTGPDSPLTEIMQWYHLRPVHFGNMLLALTGECDA